MPNGAIWIHAVSVAEGLAALPLLSNLNQLYPGQPLVVTMTTFAGCEQLGTTLGDKTKLLYLPYDYPAAIQRFLDKIHPKLLIMIGTETWPNLLNIIGRRKIPAILTNAKLAKQSFECYSKSSLAKKVINNFSRVLVQNERDRDYFLALGIAPTRVTWTGNLKFDVELPEEHWLIQIQALKTRLGNRPIWIAANTHQDEEEKILQTARVVLDKIPRALLILAPRFPEHFTSVDELCTQQGFRVVRYSELTRYSLDTEIILVDSLGKLPVFYGVSDIVLAGGSLVAGGKPNLLAPAALAKPILAGEYLQACQEISELLTERDALTLVRNERELATEVVRLFEDVTAREQLGVAALETVELHRGATDRVLAIINQLLPANP